MKNPFSRKTHPNCYEGHEYAVDIVEGKIVACIYVIGACKRYLRDIADTDNAKFFFDADKAERFLRVVQNFPHVIGKGWKSKNITYEPWQKWGWMNIMGFINRKTGFRRFRLAHWEIARGNAKSAMASQGTLYFAFLDEDPNGNQVSCVATKKEQARIVLDSSRAMAQRSPSFLKRTGAEVMAHTIVCKETNSNVRALSSEHSGLDGLQDILAVLDELHAMNRSTFDVVTSGMSKRADSLTLCITTAGHDIDSVGYSQSTFAKKLCLGEVEDDSMFAVVYTLDEKDDIYDEKNWIKANPNWAVSVDPETFRAKAEKCKTTPSDVPNFKVKHLNLWLSDEKSYYDVKKWDACYDPTLKIEDFRRKKCKSALDLATKIDLTSNVSIFRENGVYSLFFKNYIPEERVRELRNTLFDDAVARGDLIATAGDTINNERIREDVINFSKEHKIDECAYDPWNAQEMAQKLAGQGIEMVEFRMTTANLSEATKTLDVLMRQGKIRHNGSPLIRWCLSNVVAKTDANGNVFPRKTHERLKIDPIMAAIMALALWLADETKESIYEVRGLRTV